MSDDMVIEWDVPLTMKDGVELRADVFRPTGAAVHPVLMTMGPYAKGLSFQEGFPGNWERMTTAYPEVMEGSSNRYQNWETVDPEKWVPAGYVCIRVDSRGAGRSQGVLDVFSEQEAQDFYECIEWAGVQPWSNGKVGLLGISYYAINQWQVAALQPPHLAAICPWEGAVDYYRDLARHGGILSQFTGAWFERQVVRVQHGQGERSLRNPVTGELVAGPDTLPEEELAARRVDAGRSLLERPLDDEYYRGRSPDLSKVVTPLLSSGNWGGAGLHLRGNVEGFTGAATTQKWLEMHGNTHFSPFYRDEGLRLQRRFFDHFLKGEDNGWSDQPPLELQIRAPGESFEVRHESEWPLARTRWTKLYLSPKGDLTDEPVTGGAKTYEPAGTGLQFRTGPLSEPMEVTGPVAARLEVSSRSTDADVFLCLQVFDPDGVEVTFVGANDPSVPVALGWLRASHRKVDEGASLPYRPFHTHDEPWPLTPGEPVPLDVEIWPTSIVVPAGYELALTVRGHDYEHDVAEVAGAMYAMTGVGPFLHGDTEDRPREVFEAECALHFEEGREPYLLLPVIPTAEG